MKENNKSQTLINKCDLLFSFMSYQKHGMTHTPTYSAWKKMKQRCKEEPSYQGMLCDEWENDFLSFYNDIGEKPGKEYSIDRIDNDKGYQPGNVRWATKKQQQNNRNNTIFLTYQGETLPLTEWCEKLNLNPHTVRVRYLRGLPIEKVLFSKNLINR